MTFEHRRRAREKTLARMSALFLAVAIGYLALHAAVTWIAYRDAGAVAAVLTLLTLGFGDLYWMLQLAGTYGLTAETMSAAAAALLCFASWLGRPAFNRWAARFQSDMLHDASAEIGELTADASTGDGADGDSE